MGKYEEPSPLAGLFQFDEKNVPIIKGIHVEHEVIDEQEAHKEHDVQDVDDNHEVYEELDKHEEHKASDRHEECKDKQSVNTLNKPISKEEHEVYDNSVILTIAKLVNEVQKVQQVHDVYDKHDIQEVQYAQTYETTRGKKGKKLHRMNTGYTEPNWEFLVKESRQQGLRGGATELINMIIDEYRIKKK